MHVGQRVEIVNGVLKGEKGTVRYYPGTRCHREKGEVWVEFDNARRAGLAPQWYDTARLKKIR